MKTLFLLLISIASFGQNLSIVKTSFENQNVSQNSQHWIDVVDTGFANTNYQFVLLYSNATMPDSNVYYSASLINETNQWYSQLPIDTNGARRVYFTIPNQSINGIFGIGLMMSNDIIFGKVYSTTSIIEVSPEKINVKYTYTNLSGQSTTQLKGLLIRSDKKLIYFE